MGKDRHDALVFSLLTVLLTPVFLAIAVVLIVAMAYYADLPFVDYLGFWKSFLTGLNLSLTFMFIAFFVTPRRRPKRADLAWVGGAILLFGLMAALCYGTKLVSTSPGLFWPVYGGLVIGMFGFLGHAYEPKDDYYLGWWGGRIDDPFTIEDDVNRAHVALGFAAAFPRLLVGSYAEIFGSLWVWRGLEPVELSAATDVLHALASCDFQRSADRLRRLPPHSAARVVRALGKLKLVRTGPDGPRLTSEGEKLTGVSSWH